MREGWRGGGRKRTKTQRNMGNRSGGEVCACVRMCVCWELALFYVNLNLSSSSGYQPC